VDIDHRTDAIYNARVCRASIDNLAHTDGASIRMGGRSGREGAGIDTKDAPY
jgi:hypothetical protein